MNQYTTTKLSAVKMAFTLLLLLTTSASMLFAQTQSSPNIIPELVFQNAVLISGTAGQDGAIYRFNNVATGIDATVTIKKRSATNVTLTNIDLSDFGWGKAFQPQLGIAGNVPANLNWWMEFEMKFLKAGTSEKKKIKGFKVTAIDVDGDGVSIREYVQMENFRKMAFCPVTRLVEAPLVVTTSADDDDDDDDDDNNNYTKLIKGPVTNAINIDTAATTVMATYDYEDKDQITFKLGATSGTVISNAGERMSSLWFKAFSLAPPLVILPVRIASFSAWLDKGNVTVNWATESEVAFSHFVIEKSTDGREWKDIATVFSMGDTKEPVSYTHLTLPTNREV